MGNPNLLRRIRSRLGRLRHREARQSFAQEAEDLVLLRHLRIPTDRQPFYVDVGAHDPKWYSNTYLLYQAGWNGINIDATAGVADKFQRVRPRDISLECVVGDGSEIDFIDFEGHAVSGPDSPIQAERANNGHRVIGRRRVKTVALASLLANHLPPGQPIDVLSVDVEGYELPVLQSNDWDHFRPRMAMVEIGSAVSLADVEAADVTAFLRDQGYSPYVKTGLTVFFADDHFLRRSPLGFEIAYE
jgi:FkbM family methyltransferase